MRKLKAFQRVTLEPGRTARPRHGSLLGAALLERGGRGVRALWVNLESRQGDNRPDLVLTLATNP